MRIIILKMFLWSFSGYMFSGLEYDIAWNFLWDVSGVSLDLAHDFLWMLSYFAYVILQRERSFLWTSECSLESTSGSIEVNPTKRVRERIQIADNSA
jgi:hypothetical protein